MCDLYYYGDKIHENNVVLKSVRRDCLQSALKLSCLQSNRFHSSCYNCSVLFRKGGRFINISISSNDTVQLQCIYNSILQYLASNII